MSRTRDDWTRLSYKKRKKFTADLLQMYGPICCICGLGIAEGEESVQHIPPRSKGGRTSLETCRPAHRQCNYQLQDRMSDGVGGSIHNGLAAFKR